MSWISSAAFAIAFAGVILAVAWTLAPKGWRTRAANLLSIGLVLAAGGLEYLSGVYWHDVFDAKTATFVVIAVNLMNLLLRQFTSTPAGKLEDD